MRRIIAIVLAIAIAAVFLNDVGRWVNAQSRLNQSTAELAEWAATNVRTESLDQGRQTVVAEGSSRGIRVYQYDQDQYNVRVWTSVDVPGTWVVGPYMAVTNGVPVDQALSVPFVVRSSNQAPFQ